MVLTAEPSDTPSLLTVSVSEFRANCPTLFDTVRDTGQEIVVTKHGHPVAKVVPVNSSPTATLSGMAKDIIHLPPDFDIDAMELVANDWYEQWSVKWNDHPLVETNPDGIDPVNTDETDPAGKNEHS